MRPFEAYTWQHWLPLIFFLCVCVAAIRIGQRSNASRKKWIGLSGALAVLLFVVGGTIIKLYNGTFDYKDDLPLYLCRVVAWALPFAIWTHRDDWLGIFYFWILAGTLQGLITPDLAEGFPSYFYFRYWFLHAGLVVAILYAVIVFRVTITWKHFWYAISLAQIYVILVHLVNITIGSNYSYTVRKPAESILDFFGPWPWYILAGEGLMVVLFLLLMLPWIRGRKP